MDSRVAVERSSILRPSRVIAALILVGSALFGHPSSAAAAAGDLDPTFGTGGSTLIDFGGPNVDFASFVDPQDRVIVAGQTVDPSSNINTRINIARLLPDGEIDPAFGTAGSVMLDFGPRNDEVWAFETLSDGSIVGVGSTRTAQGNDALVFVLDESGNLDLGFGAGNGYTTLNYGANETALAVAVDAGQRILVGGPNFLTRLQADGSVDTGFGFGGEAGLGTAINLRGISFESDGDILLGGGVQGQLGVARLQADGQLDTSFGSNGFSASSFSGTVSPGAFAVQADGRLVVSGSNTPNPFNIDFAVTRFDTSGALDASFAGNGMTTTDLGVGDFGTGLAIQADGKLVVGGTVATAFTGSADIGLARYLPDGSLDPGFGQSGKQILNLGRFEFPRSVRLQSTGFILTTGHSASSVGRQDADLQVVRLVPNNDEDGPVIERTDVEPIPASVGSAVELTATVDDSLTGASSIAEATYQINGHVAVPMAPADGSYDETSEEVFSTIPPFEESGVFEVCVTGTDSVGNVGEPSCTLVPVYDPTAGFVTGGGRFTSLQGAYIGDPDHEGSASFGFVAKYKKGGSTPIGQTQFQLHAGGFTFHSTSYEWLVVTGNDTAKFKGTGSIDSEGDYKFSVSAGDGAPDTIRVKIWTEDEFGNELPVYDNGSHQPIDSGSIIVHSS